MISMQQFETELRGWERTPYRDTMMQRGVGVDCVRFVVAIADFIHGYDTKALPAVPELPPQTSLHSDTLAWKVVRWLQRRYPTQTIWSCEKDADDIPDVTPGCILCVKNQVHPGHALIAGPRKNVLWHCINGPSLDFGGHVHETNLHWCLSTGLLRVWRPTETLLC